MEESLLHAIREAPADDTPRLVLADWLEEQNDPRGELLRLHLRLRRQPPGPDSLAAEARLRKLLAEGVRPCVPEVVNSIGMRLALVPPGSFLMGSPEGEVGRGPDEGVHEVKISRAFYLGVFPVTQQQWEEVEGDNPSHFAASGGGRSSVRNLDTRNFPVEDITWHNAFNFCAHLSRLPAEAALQRLYRLPTEAEWEYACRGGYACSTRFHFGNRISYRHANFRGSDYYTSRSRSPSRTTAAGSYAPNALGLYDMHGNVWEWCYDLYAKDYYRRSPRKDPPGSGRGSERVFRGGAWDIVGANCRCAYRGSNIPEFSSFGLGLRVVLPV
jgi:uncharacterized protein (TIGR02996 family)